MTLQPGKAYQVRLTNGSWVVAEFLSEETYGGFAKIRARTRYSFRNLASGRTITLRSQRKVKELREAAPKFPPTCKACGNIVGLCICERGRA